LRTDAKHSSSSRCDIVSVVHPHVERFTVLGAGDKNEEIISSARITLAQAWHVPVGCATTRERLASSSCFEDSASWTDREAEPHHAGTARRRRSTEGRPQGSGDLFVSPDFRVRNIGTSSSLDATPPRISRSSLNLIASVT
jgi:hypothetical protein